MLRDLDLTSYAFSTNAQELQTRIARSPEIGQSQPFNPDVGDPFGNELTQASGDCFSALVESLSLVSGAVLRDV